MSSFPPTSTKPPRLSYESRVLWFALLAGLPGGSVALFLLWTGGFSAKVEWTFTLFVVSFWLGFAFTLREKVVRPLQTWDPLESTCRHASLSIL